MERQDSRRAGAGTGEKRRSTEGPPSDWEELLEAIERERELGREAVGGPLETDLQLVIARQLRELIRAVRPLLQHPLISRRF